SNPDGIMSGNGSRPTQTSDVLVFSQVLSCSAKGARSMMIAAWLRRREYIGGGAKFRHLSPNIDQAKQQNLASVVSIKVLDIVDVYVFVWHPSRLARFWLSGKQSNQTRTDIMRDTNVI